MKNNIRAVVIILIAAFIVGGLWFVKNQKSSNNSNTEAQAEVVVKETPTQVGQVEESKEVMVSGFPSDTNTSTQPGLYKEEFSVASITFKKDQVFELPPTNSIGSPNSGFSEPAWVTEDKKKHGIPAVPTMRLGRPIVWAEKTN